MNTLIIIASIIISAVIFFFVGVAYRKKIAESKIQSAEEEAKKMKHAISEDTINKFSDYIKSIIKVDELKCNYSPENERCQNCIKLKKKK